MAFNKGNHVSNEVLKRVKFAPTIGYRSCLGGVEVKFIEENPDDLELYVTGMIGIFAGTPTPFRRKVHYTTANDSRAFITIARTRLFLDECIRNPL